MRLQIELSVLSGNILEISSEGCSPRRVDAAEWERFGAPELTEDPPEMQKLGRELYRLLHGPEGRLAALAPNSALDLKIYAEAGRPSTLAHFPWELLHDGELYLVQQGVLPVRNIVFGTRKPTEPGKPQNRPLRVLFMACSPRDVQPVLDYETEERVFLDATDKNPLYLTPEESGSVEELEYTVGRYDPFDVFHLSGHGDLYSDGLEPYLREGQSFRDGQPVLLTEDEAGKCFVKTAADLERAFGDRRPRVAFVSGCRTGELPTAMDSTTDGRKDGRASASLAQDLLYRGFECVMGWARPVYDSSATFAAALIYGKLSSGHTVEESLRHALREMSSPGPNGQPFRVLHWHLLRCFSGGGSASALVTPTNTRGREPFVPPRLEEGFLDKKKEKYRVAGYGRFVGRRRPLQRTLPELEGHDRTGVIVWGMGGLGKSSLAARLCDRMERRNESFERAVLVGVLNERTLLLLLKGTYAYDEATLKLDGSLPLSGRLRGFFKDVERPSLLVLDDFEDNIEIDGGEPDGFRLRPEAFATLVALDDAIHRSGRGSRLIVTSRYWGERAFPPNHLFAEQLPQMDRAELRKKARNEVRGEEAEPEKWITESGGNPRLFEILAKKDIEGKIDFDKSLQLAKLAETLSLEDRQSVARLSVFELPVTPELAHTVIGEARFVAPIGLGLVERDEDQLLRVANLLRGHLSGVFDHTEWEAVHGAAAREAHRAWIEDAEYTTEAQRMEVVRLAVVGNEREIACGVANPLLDRWNNLSRYRETVSLASFVLSRFEDHRLLSTIATAERLMGDTDSALNHLARAEAAAPSGDEHELVYTLHEKAHLRAQQGDVAGAIDLFGRSLDIQERIGNEQGRAAALHEMAGLRAQQDNVAAAMDLYRQAHDILERIGDTRGKAATLHQMATLCQQQGDVAAAMDLYRQSIEIKERIGDARGKAATLANMAGLAFEANQLDQAAGHSMEAARTIAQVRAWPDLATVLENLAVIDQTGRTNWIAQATWLAVGIRFPSFHDLVQSCFHTVPTGHPLELRLAVLYLVSGEGQQDEGMKMFSVAAHNQSMTQEQAQAWFDNAVAMPDRLVQETLAQLESLVEGEWIFNRTTVLAGLEGLVAESALRHSARRSITRSMPSKTARSFAGGRMPARSTSWLRSTAVSWETLATLSLGSPVRRADNSTLPGASAHLRLLVSGTHRTVDILVRLNGSPCTMTAGRR